MKLSEIKTLLPTLNQVSFRLEDGSPVPEHFHVTEVGTVTKHFIDCGGTVRHETLTNFQLWSANDHEHRLLPGKLLHIITLCEEKLGIADTEIEVEYQHGTIGKYALGFDGTRFVLQNKATACLAMDTCGISEPNTQTEPLATAGAACCTPGGRCCA